MSQFVFQKATKNQLPARICIAGPTGSGKTYTATLEMAPVLGTKRLQIDTEHGSGALYADMGDYDYYRFDPPYDPARLVEVLQAADSQGYEVIIVDSLSHFWDGEGGTIDIADAAGQRASGNSFAGWKVATPALRHLVDVMLDLKAHLIVTMRSKMEYVLETNERGKQVPRKVGMAPVMRQGIEYEFALVADMDLDHRMVISKSRCSELADMVVQPHRAKEMTQTFKAWLTSGAEMATPEQIATIRAAFDTIENDESRFYAKKNFADVYGAPDRLNASQIEPALAFARTLAAPVESQPPAATAPPAAEPPSRLTEKPAPADAHEMAQTALEFAYNAMPDAADRERCRAEVKRTFGEPFTMELDEFRAAMKIIEDWPKAAEAPPAADPVAKPPVRSGKLRGLLAYARGVSLDEQHLVALACFLASSSEPRPLEELDEGQIKSITSLIDDVKAGTLLFMDGPSGLVAKEAEPA